MPVSWHKLCSLTQTCAVRHWGWCGASVTDWRWLMKSSACVLSNSFKSEEHSSSRVSRCLTLDRSCWSDSVSFYRHFLIFCSITANNQSSATERAPTLQLALSLSPSAEEDFMLLFLWTDVHLISIQTKSTLHLIQTVVKHHARLQTLDNDRQQWQKPLKCQSRH